MNENLIAAVKKRAWKKTARNPAVLAIGLALAVIVAIVVYQFRRTSERFSRDRTTAQKLLVVASTHAISQLEPVRPMPVIWAICFS